VSQLSWQGARQHVERGSVTESNRHNVTMHMARRRRDQVAVRVGSRNVYADLGFANADATLRKAHIASELSRTIKRAGCTEREAARRLRVPHMTLSKVMRGQFERIAERTLRSWLGRLNRKKKRGGTLADFFASSPLRSSGPKVKRSGGPR